MSPTHEHEPLKVYVETNTHGDPGVEWLKAQLASQIKAGSVEVRRIVKTAPGRWTER